MTAKCVRELMIPLDDYAVVPRDASLVEAVRALSRAEQKLRPVRQPARAALVADPEGRIIGQLGHLEILQALEPSYSLLGDLGTLSRAGVSEELFASLKDNLSFWRGELSSVCRRARNIKVSDLMRPIAESISEDAPLSEATHKMVIWQSMRALVTRRGRVVGVLRLADLVAEVAECIESEEGEDESPRASVRAGGCGAKQTTGRDE
jgi:CBS domain-containing protein